MKKVLFLMLAVLLFVVSVTPAVIAAGQDSSALIDLQAKPQPPAEPFE